MENKLLIGLATAACIGLVGDHVLVRGDVQEEIGRSEEIDNHQEKVDTRQGAELKNLTERIIQLETREGIYHRD